MSSSIGGPTADTTRLPELAAELVKLNVDVIVTHSTPGSRAAKQATSTVPIKIGNRVQVGGGSSVFGDLADGMKVIGSPAIPIRDYARLQLMLKRLISKKK